MVHVQVALQVYPVDDGRPVPVRHAEPVLRVVCERLHDGLAAPVLLLERVDDVVERLAHVVQERHAVLQHVLLEGAGAELPLEHEAPAHDELGKDADVPGIGVEERHGDVAAVVPVELDRRLDHEARSHELDMRAGHALRHAGGAGGIDDDHRAEIVHADPVSPRDLRRRSGHRFIQAPEPRTPHLIIRPGAEQCVPADHGDVADHPVYLVRRIHVGNQEGHLCLVDDLGQRLAAEAGIDGEKDGVAQARGEGREHVFRRIFHVHAKRQPVLRPELPCPDQLSPLVEKKVRVPLRLRIDLAVGIFLPLEDEENAVFPVPHEAHGEFQHGLEIDIPEKGAQYCFKIHGATSERLSCRYETQPE